MSRQLIGNSHRYCYICGQFTSSKNLKAITPLIEQRYNKHFYPLKLAIKISHLLYIKFVASVQEVLVIGQIDLRGKNTFLLIGQCTCLWTLPQKALSAF